MNNVFYYFAWAFLAFMLTTQKGLAQKKDTTTFNIDNVKITITDDGDTVKNKDAAGRHSISISTNGIRYQDAKKPIKKHKKLHTGMHFDFGFNNIIDQTDYIGIQNNQGLVATDSSFRNLNGNDLALKNGKSINFNFWPVWLKQDIAKHSVQIETGLGFQFFNYRFESSVKHTDEFNSWTGINSGGAFYSAGFEDVPVDRMDIAAKAKNKLGVSYVSIPLMIRFNSDKKKGHRYFVGAGVIGSYKLKSWTKFYGEKASGRYAINDWMTQVTAELGVTGVIKLYGTYALQSMYSNGLERQPFAIGIRL